MQNKFELSIRQRSLSSGVRHLQGHVQGRRINERNFCPFADYMKTDRTSFLCSDFSSPRYYFDKYPRRPPIPRLTVLADVASPFFGVRVLRQARSEVMQFRVVQTLRDQRLH